MPPRNDKIFAEDIRILRFRFFYKLT